MSTITPKHRGQIIAARAGEFGSDLSNEQHESRANP